MEVNVYKLISGEEVIGRDASGGAEDVIVLEKARVVQLAQGEHGRAIPVFLPYSIAAIDGNVVLVPGAIAGFPATKPDERLVAKYIQETTSIVTGV